jgi:hypothetical protein
LVYINTEVNMSQSIEFDSIASCLWFLSDTSPKIKKFMKVMLGKLQQGEHGSVVSVEGALALELLKAKLEEKAAAEMGALQPAMDQEVDNVQEVYVGTMARVPSNDVLISGFQTDQTSIDTTTSKGESDSALSNAILTILVEHETVMNKELVLRSPTSH